MITKTTILDLSRYPALYSSFLCLFPGVRPFKCDTCPKAYFQKSDLERHIKLQHLQVTTIGENGVIQKPFRCMECPKSFAQSCDLERHIRTHAGIRPYKCEQVSPFCLFHAINPLTCNKAVRTTYLLNLTKLEGKNA